MKLLTTRGIFECASIFRPEMDTRVDRPCIWGYSDNTRFAFEYYDTMEDAEQDWFDMVTGIWACEDEASVVMTEPLCELLNHKTVQERLSAFATNTE